MKTSDKNAVSVEFLEVLSDLLLQQFPFVFDTKKKEAARDDRTKESKFEEGIDAYKAQAMGLVDLVFPSEYLVEDALNFAHGLCKAPSRLIRAAKRLINVPPVALSTILEKENEVITESIFSERFRKQLEKNKRDADRNIPWF